VVKAGSKEFRWTIALIAAATLGACAGPAQRSNLERCLANDYTCNPALLTETETQRLIDADTPLHFQDCLAGRRCNETLLDEPELRQVRQAVAQLNFQACVNGEAGCRQWMLTGAQREETGRAEGARNFGFCLSGISECDPSTLTDSQRAAAREAWLQRNFAACMNSVGTLLPCNRAELSAEQLELVDRRNLAVNLYICSNALIGCNEGLLTEEQRVAVQAEKSNR